MPTVAFHNLGCKVNGYETDIMIQEMKRAGYTLVPFEEEADVYVVNTCSVTNVADRKSRQMLHRGKKINPDAIVVGVGCYVQMWKEQTDADPAVDIVIGNNKKKEIASIIEEYRKRRRETGTKEENREAACSVMEDADVWRYEDGELDAVSGHTRAYVKIQDGCNQFCSYCIIPYARGRIRSRRLSEIEKEITSLAETGCKEVVLTGIHLSSYGKDWKEETITLLDAVRLVNRIDGIERIRLGSLEPGIITESFAEALASMEKVCPHFHLSLQSGSDTVLKRMNRHYNTNQYYEKCGILRNYYDNPALTTDVIAGFPGETEEEHRETLAFLKKAAFAEMHIFKYSMRKGTKAAAMGNQVKEEIKARRSGELLSLDAELRRRYEQTFLGTEQPVLFEERILIGDNEFQVGHTMNYLKVAVKSREKLENQIRPVILAGWQKEELLMGNLK